MFQYEQLRKRPRAFRALTGMSETEFLRLLPDFLAAQAAAKASSTSTRAGGPRLRAPGAGAKPKVRAPRNTFPEEQTLAAR